MTKKSPIRPWWWNIPAKDLIKGRTERLIKESSPTTNGDNSPMESKIMNIDEIEIYIRGTKYRLVPVGSGDTPEADGIASLKAGMKKVDLSAEVAKDWKLNVFKRSTDGSEGRVHSLLVTDGNKSIKVALWDTHAETVKDIQEGDTIVISNGYVKNGQLKEGVQYIELHVGKFSDVAVVPKGE